MTLEKKLLKLEIILEDSELIKTAIKQLGEDAVEEMVVELRKELIGLLEQ